VESPNYRAVLQEALDTSFRRLFDELRRSKFELQGSGGSLGGGISVASSADVNTTSATAVTAGAEASQQQLARPPLAVLLPEFRKLVNGSLLPENPLVLSRVASEVCGAPSLDALCVLAFDNMSLPPNVDGSMYY
jgi:hypothetical protein